MRYPKFLQRGGTIGFVAPSFGCNIEPYKTAFKNALATFEKMGYQVDLGPNCYEGSGIGISNTPEKCAEEINEYYASSGNDILMSCGGGELMCEILPHLDFDALKQAEPKWYLGYSDNTNLIYTLTTICDTAAIYGPCAPSFGMEPWHKCLGDAMDVLTGKTNIVTGYDAYEVEGLKDEEHPLAPYNPTEKKELKLFGADGNTTRNVNISGRLVGGCMDCLVNLLGTSFDKTADFLERYKEDGFIWFLESCDLNVMAIRRAMWQMDNAGWFKYVKGFMIGRPLVHGQELMGLDQYEAVLGIVRKYNVPVIMDADFGHIPPAMPIVSGALAEVKAECNNISIEYTLK